MHDQADELRELVRRAALENSWVSTAVPRLIVVSGGKGGVGTTTVAVNLAVALAAQGHRTVLVDANLNRGGVGRLCCDVYQPTGPQPSARFNLRARAVTTAILRKLLNYGALERAEADLQVWLNTRSS